MVVPAVLTPLQGQHFRGTSIQPSTFPALGKTAKCPWNENPMPTLLADESPRQEKCDRVCLPPTLFHHWGVCSNSYGGDTNSNGVVCMPER